MSHLDDVFAKSREVMMGGNPGVIPFVIPRGSPGLKFGGVQTNMVLQPTSLFQYTIIANWCFFFLNFDITNKGPAAGAGTIDMRWGGFENGFQPDLSIAATARDFPCKFNTINLTGFIQMILTINATGFDIYRMPANGARSTLTATQFASPCSFNCMGSFPVRLA